MPLQYSQFTWGFEVFDSGPNKNNRLAFVRNGTTYDGDGANPAATLPAGVYTADELATEVANALNTRASSLDITCSFDYTTLKFTITIPSGTPSLLFAGTVAATDCNVLLGFHATNSGVATTFQSDVAVRGFEVIASGGAQNNRIAFYRNGTTYDGDGGNPAATLIAGFYTPEALAAEVQRAMRERTSTTDITCTFSYATAKFTIAIASPGNLSLLFAGTVAATDCNVLLGFTATNHNTDGANDGDSYPGDNAVAAASPGSPGAPAVWEMAEPLLYNSPVSAQAPGTAANGTPRFVGTRQQVSDGGSVESIYFSTVKVVSIAFRALGTTEQEKMEAFLAWATQGKRLTWQPNKTSSNLVKLVMASPGGVMPTFEWLTRSEVGYGTFTFYEQLS